MTRETILSVPLVSGSVPAEGLQHAPDSVVEVQAKCTHCDDIEERNGPDGKRCHHVLVNGEIFELTRRNPTAPAVR